MLCITSSGWTLRQEDNLCYQVADGDDDGDDGEYLIMWTKENENYHKQPHQAQQYMEKVILVMISSGPWIEGDVGDDHDCGDDDHDDGGT